MEYDSPISPAWAINLRKKTNMKSERLSYALIAGILALVVLLLSGVRSNVHIDTVIAYSAIVVLVALAALEYRIRWKSLVGK